MAEDQALTNGDHVARLRSEIEHTRAAMADTLDAIQVRLSPQHLKAQAKESIREATIGRVRQMGRKAGDKAGAAGRGIMDVARDNPLPLALIGLGAGWLLYNARRRRHERETPRVAGTERAAIGYESAYMENRSAHVGTPYPAGPHTEPEQGVVGRARERAGVAAESVRHRVSDAGDTVKSAASDALHRVGDVASDVSHKVGEVAGTVTHGLQRAEERAQNGLNRMRYEYDAAPWAGAAVALALGAAAGLAMPSTQREDALLGERRDELMDRAQELGREKLDAASRVAEEVMADTRESIAEHARQEGLADPARDWRL
jgi:hypothetical protein